MQVEPTSQRQQAFDVCVEVSGSISGLQLAIDSTIAGGRVVIGSWYSSSSETSNNNRAALRLGTRFYRSGIQLITSQVSSIPATISDRWDKARKFNTVWGVISRYRPSRLLRLGGHVVAHRGKCTVYVCTHCVLYDRINVLINQFSTFDFNCIFNIEAGITANKSFWYSKVKKELQQSIIIYVLLHQSNSTH
jgi:hypothetical protein